MITFLIVVLPLVSSALAVLYQVKQFAVIPARARPWVSIAWAGVLAFIATLVLELITLKVLQ